MTGRTPRAPLAIVTCEASRALAERVADSLGVPIVPSKETWFACGEGKIEIEGNVRGSDLYIFQAPIAPGDARSTYDRFMMTLHAVEAARLADASYVTAVLPYYPGARQDKRKGRTREGISAGLFARFLEAAGAHRVVSVEIHNEAISGMFNPSRCRMENIFLHKMYSHWIADQGLAGDIVAAPDVGGLERARYYAEDLNLGLAVISKERDYRTPNRVLTSTLIGDVKDMDVLLVDDIIDTAGSVVAAVTELRDNGARNVTVACAHPVFSGPAWERLTGLAQKAEQEGWRFRVVGTTSIEHNDAPDWYLACDIAELLGRVIRSINSRGSVTYAQEH